MKYLEQIKTDNNRFVDYIKGTLIFIFFYILGQIPLTLFVISKSNLSANPINQNDIFSGLPPNITLFLVLLPFVAVVPFVYLVVTRLHQRSFTSLVTSRKRVDYKRILFSFLLWGTVSASMVIFDYWINPDDYVWNFKPLAFLILFLISIVMIPLQTSMEELVFRGYLVQGFGVLCKNRWMPLLITSVLFGLLHIWNPEIDKLGIHLIWYYIGTGLFLGVITLMDEGMELALGFHAANNLVTALFVTASWTAFQTESLLIDNSEPSLGLELIITLALIYPSLAFIFAKKYQWKNWITQLTHKFK
ncbi:CPBP family intramembrane metalloprotease [Flavobacteriaceae bacterium]|nr:CPBP family intramembrane metalloprotease [Flavobacteriaceae bacterium]